MKNLSAIVLAAGKGTRMKSDLPKVLHEVAGRPMLHYPLEVLRELGAGRVAVVVGHGREQVRERFSEELDLKKFTFVTQAEQKGTGDAVMSGLKGLRGVKGDVLILSGDVPLITGSTVKALARVHRRGGAKSPVITVLTAMLSDPSGYGRVIRDPSTGAVIRIVEHKDCTAEELETNEINTGIYLVSIDYLRKNISGIGSENAQGEYYLPDLIGMASGNGLKVGALTHVDADEVMGINNRVELAKASKLMRTRILTAHMLAGVTMVDPDAAYIESGVEIGRDTVIHPGAHIKGGSRIGKGCVIEEGAVITGSVVGDGSVVRSYSVVEDSVLGRDVAIGPLARLRPGNRLSDGARVGNFVEVKNSTIGKGSKANHLTYIGDANVGEGVNVGAGTITCNYDGVKKHRTVIEDGAFIGSDSQLVAPVTVGKNAYVGSGTTVTADVPPWSLVLARAETKVVKDWVRKKGLKKKKK